MAVTVRDVAARAGVSPRTVSNVINDFQYVSAEMRTRVETAIRELDYRPNLLARSLRSGRTGLITLLVPEIGVPYFAELAHEIIEQAHDRSWTVLLDETGGAADREYELIMLASQARFVDGILLSALGLGDARLQQLSIDLPVVLLGEQTSPVLDHVGIDNVGAAQLAVEHLIGLGRRRIGVIGREQSRIVRTGKLRLTGYRRALRSAGLPYDPALVARISAFHRQDGADAARALMALPEPPDAIFAFNDSLALGALRALHECGVTVPQDVAVVGFDDVEEGRFSTPTLTSVAPAKSEVARHALDLLGSRIDGTARKPREVVVGHHLAVRESTQA